MKDYIILVDENNNILGTAPKLKSHNSNTPLHRAFSVFLFNDKKQLLLQKRSFLKKTWAGVWSNSCCGHQKLDEDLIKTSKERLKFELNISKVTLKIILPNYRYRFEKDKIVENEICPVLVGFTNENPKLNTEEVEEIKWINWNDWIKEISLNPMKYSQWCVEESLLLEKNSEFKSFLGML